MGKKAKTDTPKQTKEDKTEQQEQKWLLLYPLYLDKAISRNKGRQVKNKLAIPNLKLKEITKVLKKLEIPFKLEADEKHKCLLGSEMVLQTRGKRNTRAGRACWPWGGIWVSSSVRPRVRHATAAFSQAQL